MERLIRKEDKSFIDFQGTVRSYLYYEPENLISGELLSLLVLLHGGGANAENAMRMADAEVFADKYRTLIIYPDGYGDADDRVYTWNAGTCCGLAKERDSDDVSFLKTLIQQFCRQYNIRTDCVMVAGFSNGAMMAHRFGIEASEFVSSIAAISGGMNYQGAPPAHPVSVLSVHGMKDTHAPYEGGAGPDTRYPRVDRPVREGVQKWADWNRCRKAQTETLLDGEVLLHRFIDGKEGSAVLEYLLLSQGHAWPGGKFGLRYGNVDQPFRGLNITKIIYDFMHQHPRMTAL